VVSILAPETVQEIGSGAKGRSILKIFMGLTVRARCHS
jgi:hypothetical protein